MIDKHLAAVKKMREIGIPISPVNIYTDVQRALSKNHKDILEKIKELILSNARKFDVKKEGQAIVKDSGFDLLQQLKYLLFSEYNNVYSIMKNQVRAGLNKSRRVFYKDYFKNADDKMKLFLVNLALNKDDVFHQRMENLQEIYLEKSIERIKGEQDNLKKQFLERLTGWIEGKEEKLDIKDLVDEMKQTSVRQSKFFARDQLGKFNKSLLIASLKQAGVKRVKWITCHDRSVRGNPIGLYPKAKPSHYAFDGKEFDIDQIPDAFFDYLCRCTLIPIW